MTIRIDRGLYDESCEFIFFIGSSTDGIRSANARNYLSSVEPQLDPTDPDKIKIKDTTLSISNGYDTYELEGVHYSEWRDADDNPFSSAVEVRDYVNQQITLGLNGIQDIIGQPRISPATLLIVGVNSFFSYKVNDELGIGYYWEENTFPNGVEVSRYDRRRITGIITETGSWLVTYEVANGNGIQTSSVNINALVI